LLRDRTSSVDILIPGLALSALEDDAFLAGGNRFALETDQGWEIIGARDAVLIGPQTYRLSHLLRGLDGSADFMAQTLPSGARVLWLGAGVASLPLSDEWRGTTISLSGSSGSRTARPAEIVWNNIAELPLSPVHLRWDGTTLSWIGRDRAFTDWTEDASHLRYRANIYRGTVIETIETASTSISLTPFDWVEIYQISQFGRESLSPATLNVTSA
jgi:hypothetical protein